MKLKHYIFAAALLGGSLCSLSSCEDMENEPLEIGSDDYTWDVDDYTGQYAVQWLNGCYVYVPGGLARYNGQPLDVFAGDALPSDYNSAAWPFIRNGYSMSSMFSLDFSKGADNFGDSWDKLYAAIRRCNIFLNNYQKVPFSSKDDKTYYGAECRALRAYFYMLLLRDYGGVPLLGDNVYTAQSPELKEYSRRSYEDCVNFIASEFEAVKDSLRPYPDIATRQIPVDSRKEGVYQNGEDVDYAKIRKWAVLGLEARLYLYAASALYNGTNKPEEPWLGYPEAKPELWKKAADLCRQIMNSGQFILEPIRSQLSMTYINGEFLWCKSSHGANQLYGTNQWAAQQVPMGFKMTDLGGSGGGIGNQTYGGGRTSPTQELVDAFPMKNGLSIDDPASGYDPKNPYANRDPRLGETVFYNGQPAFGRTIETYEGGRDNSTADPTKESSRTKTGYYTHKFVLQSEDGKKLHRWGIDHQNFICQWCNIRYADVLLMYAEAQTEWLHSQGQTPDESVYEAVEAVRRRGLQDETYSLKRGLTYEQITEIIRQERRIEFAFEENWFWDIRRWKIAGELFNKGLHGMDITKNADGSFTYNKVEVVKPYWDDRMYYYPIAEKETLYNPNIKQNPGY